VCKDFTQSELERYNELRAILKNEKEKTTMNREILFRGKSLFKSEWWQGYYIYSRYDNKHYIVQDSIISGNINQFVSFAHFAEVDFNTIGQYTGIQDENGAKIFEGDIIKAKGLNFVVEWVEEYLTYAIIKTPAYSVYKDDNYFKYSHLETNDKIYFICQLEAYEIAVIGNIHDNPEMIK